MSKISMSALDLIYLVSCALNDKTPERDRVAEMNLEEIYLFAQFHSLTACTAMVLENCGVQNSSAFQKFKQAKEKAIRKNILLDNEREQILAYMENQGIWYLPLKGIILKELYPKLGMRQMSDNDILFDPAYKNKLSDFMKSRGYEMKAEHNDCHNGYLKPPVYNFEMHTLLFGASGDKKLIEYYSGINDKLLSDNGKRFAKCLSDDDFYIYITAHGYKHFISSGTGLRTLVDCYIYWQKKGSSLNESYINDELQKLGVSDYEQMCRDLSQKLFSADDEFNIATLSEKECESLDYIFSSGTYGTKEGYIKNKLSSIYSDGKSGFSAKLEYYLKRVFLPINQVKVSFPFFYRYKIFLPFLWIYRILRGIFLKRENIKKEIKILNSYIAQEKQNDDGN